MPELMLSGRLQSFDADKRELYGLIVPWEQDAETNRGLELFERGAFAGVDPLKVVLRMRHQDPPTGRGIAIEDREDGAYMRFRVSRTPAGDEQLTLAADEVERGLSVGFEDGEVVKERVGDRTRYRHRKVTLSEVSTTWRPAYAPAAIMQIRSKEMPENQETAEPVTPAETPQLVIDNSFIERTTERIAKLEERQRELSIVAPRSPEAEKLTTERKVLLQVRELAEVITTDNLGVVPDAFVNEMVGIIDATRPFLNSTRKLTTPNAGVELILPRITQRPLVATQAAEKDELASRKTVIDTVSFGMITKGGAADLSMQLIKRSSPEFLSLWLELLGEAYAIETEDAAVDALLATVAVNEGTAAFAPLNGDISFGEAFRNSQAISRRMFPDTLWVSTEAVGDMIDAKTDGTNLPMFGNLNLNANANGGVQGTVSGLTVVHVPALDNEVVDAIVGPSRGFAWAEDGTYVLQADVPAKFGRDVGLAGMIWYAPIYPAAFTTYTKTS